MNVYLIALISLFFIGNVEHGTLPFSCLLGFARGDIAMVSAMMQAVTIQMCVIPMYQELEDRSPRKFNRCVNIAFLILFFIFAGFSVLAELNFGAISFADPRNSNILMSIPVNYNTVKGFCGVVSQIGMIVSITSVYPIMLAPMIAPVRNSEVFQKFTVPVTTLIVVGTAVIALFITNLGFLNVLNGSCCMAVFVGIVPGVVGWYLLEMPWYGMLTLITCAVVMGVLGMIYTSNFVEDIENGCFWALGK